MAGTACRSLPQIQPPPTDRVRRRDRLILAVVAVLYAWNLGAPELTDTDESRSGVIVRDMVEGGRWLLPRTPDGYLSEKPPAYSVRGCHPSQIELSCRPRRTFQGSARPSRA